MRISFLAMAIASKKFIQNHQWNLRKVVAIWRSQWNLGLALGLSKVNKALQQLLTYSNLKIVEPQIHFCEESAQVTKACVLRNRQCDQ